MWWNGESVVVQDHVPRAPEASASSSGFTDQSLEAIAARGIVQVLNIKTSEGTPPGLPITIIPVDDIIGRLNDYPFNPIDVVPFKMCCGANGRIQLYLAAKPKFQDVAKFVKTQVRSYLDDLRTRGDPSVLRLTSCGCTPVSHIS